MKTDVSSMEQPKQDCRKSTARLERACGRFFIKLMLVLLPFVAVDFASRYFWSHRRSKIEREFPVEIIRHPQPYVMFGGIPGSVLPSGERLNDLGYRGKSPSGPKTAGERRVFILGGSTVFSGEPPIAELLEDVFRDNGRTDVHVYNFSVVSSVCGMELARILYEIGDLAPDVIIMYNGSNDIILPLTHDPRPGYPFNFIVQENNPLLDYDIKSYQGINLLLYGSNFARYLISSHFMDSFVPLDDVRQSVGWNSDAWRGALARAYVANMVRARKVSNAFGAHFIGFLQPLVYYKDSPAPEETTNSFRPQRKQHAVEVRQHIRNQIALLAEQDRTTLVDLSDVFDDTADQVFTDYVHTNQKGKKIVADAIYHQIIAHGLLK